MKLFAIIFASVLLAGGILLAIKSNLDARHAAATTSAARDLKSWQDLADSATKALTYFLDRWQSGGRAAQNEQRALEIMQLLADAKKILSKVPPDEFHRKLELEIAIQEADKLAAEDTSLQEAATGIVDKSWL